MTRCWVLFNLNKSVVTHSHGWSGKVDCINAPCQAVCFSNAVWKWMLHDLDLWYNVWDITLAEKPLNSWYILSCYYWAEKQNVMYRTNATMVILVHSLYAWSCMHTAIYSSWLAIAFSTRNLLHFWEGIVPYHHLILRHLTLRNPIFLQIIKVSRRPESPW